MNFLKTIVFGVILGLIIGLLGIIPFCSCFIGPMLCLLCGFLLGKIIKLKMDDYGTLTINLIIYSVSGGIIGTIINYLINMFYNTNIVSLSTMTSIFGEIIFPFLYVGGMLFVFGAIGGLVYMFTKK
jgi:hypothetical protein